MRHKRFGSTGLFVSELCFGHDDVRRQRQRHLGSHRSTAAGRGRRSDEACPRCRHQFHRHGERLQRGAVGAAHWSGAAESRRRARHVVVATKVFGEMGKGANARGAVALSHHGGRQGEPASGSSSIMSISTRCTASTSPRRWRRRCVRSTRWSSRGMVRYIGVSNWAAWQIAKALGMSERLGLARFDSLQAYYTIAGRDLEREIVPMLQGEGLGLMVWSPLAGGLLSGKYSRQSSGENRQPADDVRLSAGADGPSLRRHRRDARHRRCERRQRRPGRDRLASPSAGGDQRHHRRQAAGSAGRQYRRDNVHAVGRGIWRRSIEASALPAEYPGWMLERQGGARRQQLSGKPKPDCALARSPRPQPPGPRALLGDGQVASNRRGPNHVGVRVGRAAGGHRRQLGLRPVERRMVGDEHVGAGRRRQLAEALG